MARAWYERQLIFMVAQSDYPSLFRQAWELPEAIGVPGVSFLRHLCNGVADHFVNTDWLPDRPFAGSVTGAVSPDEMDRAVAVITGWSEYAPTPLVSLPGLAGRIGVGTVLCKDESRRFGVGGIKALGACYGLHVLAEGRQSDQPFTAIAATDGNHGLALAWAARRTGGHALIFVGRDVDAVRLDRIRSQGAEIAVVDGTYDDAVLAAETAAAEPSRLLVTDTDYTGELRVCRAIMAGYSVLANEVWRELKAFPTHLFLQCGVGSMAAGVTAGLWRRSSPMTPRVVTVEPVAAACALASLRVGRSTSVTGDLKTRMAGLACGRLSLPAWTILSQTTFAAIAVTDGIAATVQRCVSERGYGDAALSTGDTGVAGLAGLVAAASDRNVRGLLRLDAESRVLVINSEGPLQ
jgi:diaminopropionate ammonia-lyase